MKDYQINDHLSRSIDMRKKAFSILTQLGDINLRFVVLMLSKIKIKT